MKRPPHHRPSDTEAIEATAAAWITQREDQLTASQAAEFLQWRTADPRHELAAARLEATCAALRQLREFRPEARTHPDKDLLRGSPKARRVVAFPALPAIGALAASLIIAVLWWFVPALRNKEIPVESYVTTTDGYERVTLPDRSIAELNSASEIHVQFTSAERRVRLVRGEAHFTVAKNKARPFFVEAGPVAVRAVGTAFDVRLGLRDVEVLVTEGRVTVAASSSAEKEKKQRAGGGGEQSDSSAVPLYSELGANNRIVISRTTANQPSARLVPPAIEKVTPEAMREILAWQGPRLVFVDTPLAEAIAQFNRHNIVQIELADPELGELPVGGSFRPENAEAFVRLIEASNGGITVERPDAMRIVLHAVK